MSVNKCILIGRLGQDPTTKYMPNGESVTNATLATSESWKDKASGQKQERTEWHNLVFYRRLAEIAGEYLRKGSQIYVEGRLQTRSWEKDGVKRYTTDIIVNEMTMLGSNQDSQKIPTAQQQPAPQQNRRPAPSPAPQNNFDNFDDDIPF